MNYAIMCLRAVKYHQEVPLNRCHELIMDIKSKGHCRIDPFVPTNHKFKVLCVIHIIQCLHKTVSMLFKLYYTPCLNLLNV